VIGFLRLACAAPAAWLVYAVPDVSTYLLAAIVAAAVIAGPGPQKDDRP
jgi:hypothetical protein